MRFARIRRGHRHAFARRALLAAAAVLLGGCATRAPEAALQAISPLALQAHMAYLADDRFQGRMTGTAEYELAARYVASQFRAIGLEAGMGQSFLQPVPLISGTLDIPRSALVLHGVPGGRTLRFREDYVVYANLADAHQHVRAPLVFAGHGVVAEDLGHDDYAGLDVRGKIVVLFPRAPATFPADERAFYSSSLRKAQDAAARGAVGVISIRNQYSRERYPWEKQARNAGTQPTMRWQQADGTAAAMASGIQGKALLADTTAEALFAQGPHPLADLLAREAAGDALPGFTLPVEAEIVTHTRLRRLQSSNVLGRLPGTDPERAGEHVVLVAHLDHLGVGAAVAGDAIYNGAYDNAMGVGLMIETARALKARGTRRSVLFAAVTAEERGLLGSHYLARHPPASVTAMSAAITLDMPLLLFPMQEVIGFGGEHSSLQAFVERAAAAENVALAPDPLPNEVLFVRSDHYSFVREGVPGLFFFPGFHSADDAVDGQALVMAHLAEHYHKPSDDLLRPVHWPSAVRFARINVRLAELIANSPEPPAWKPDNVFARHFARPAALPSTPAGTP